MKWGRVCLVVFGALIITAFGIDAADTISGNTGTMLSQVISRNSGGCPKGMVAVESVSGVSCVDIYESSPSAKCPVSIPSQMIATQQNIETPECTSESKKDAEPWRYISRDQAMQMCARGGKRLPTSEEWYLLTIGMANVESSCNIDSKKVAKTGEYQSCSTPSGAYDFVGNLWEWVSDDVMYGQYNGYQLPENGYVAQVDGHGMSVVTQGDSHEMFGKDYFWSKKEGVYGIIRGGYYDSGSDAGIYTVHADTLPTTASAGIGFRCVK